MRQALYALQLGFRQAPGLVADGRDMGTVIFPNARLKVFLTASVEARAERRYKQLIGKGISANMEGLLADLQARDERDTHRTVAPLVAAEGAYILDTSDMTVDEAVEQVLHWHTLLYASCKCCKSAPVRGLPGVLYQPDPVQDRTIDGPAG